MEEEETRKKLGATWREIPCTLDNNDGILYENSDLIAYLIAYL